jgi:hypothetical protein
MQMLNFRKPLVRILLFLGCLLLTLSCSGIAMQETATHPLPTIEDIPQTTWEAVAHKRILFPHASVGADIMAGVEDLLQENPQIPLRVVESNVPWTVNSSGLIHFHWGELALWTQGQYTSRGIFKKLDVFGDLMNVETAEGKLGDQIDMAFFKLCWADIKDDTDLNEVIAHYKTVMNQLMETFPNTKLVLMTVPLVGNPAGWEGMERSIKNRIKHLIGREPFSLADNQKINTLNDLLKREFDNTMPVFDLAKVESTYPDGRRSSNLHESKTVYSLATNYTDDGGHLNSWGRRFVAEQLLIFLTEPLSPSTQGA